MQQPSEIHITPTARQARSLVRELAAHQTAEGQLAWVAPVIDSFPAWLNRIRNDYVLNADDDRTPINAEQALHLWQSLIDREVFIGEPQVADLAQRSWRLIHEHDLEPPEQWPALLLSEDSRRFKDWTAAYRAKCADQGLLDEWPFAAEIAQHVAEGRIDVPGTIELVGFELPMTPLQGKILAAFEAAGTILSRREPLGRDSVQPALLQYDEADDELSGAALWARHLLEETPTQSIAVVVPDLSGRVDRVESLFREVFDPPGFSLEDSGPEPWHISLGKPLAEWPLVTDALAILSLSNHALTQPQASRLLRSPYLSSWEDEGNARNQTLGQLAQRAPYDLTIDELQRELRKSAANVLAENLAAWQSLRNDTKTSAWPSEWVGILQEELSSLGFGRGRALSSCEHQVLQRWHDLLEAFSTIDVVSNGPVSRPEALAMLSQRAHGTVFRERNRGVPVEILGVEEALGSQFDALWITTLDNNTWPGPPRRDPLIPAAVQSNVPHATSDGCLLQAQLELAGLLASAPITRGSFARGSEETAIEVTALLPNCPLETADTEVTPVPADMTSPYPDDQAPALKSANAKGGTGVLRDQSSCPFRAFAARRLNAIEQTPPRPGLDAGQRGTVIHKALEHFWKNLHGSAELAVLQTSDQEQHVRSAVRAAIDEVTNRFSLSLTAAGRVLEQRRTERVLSRWLDVEKQRAEFSVVERERDITLNLAGLTLTGQIDRLDRHANGTTMLIDYKTGRSTKSDWFPEPRIVDPQLPAYAISMVPKPSAIAFASIRPENLHFDGLADGEIDTSGVVELANEGRRFRELESWSELLQDWRTHLEALARDFIAGSAAVDPRNSKVCNTCHLHALCRVQERARYESLTGEDDNG